MIDDDIWAESDSFDDEIRQAIAGLLSDAWTGPVVEGLSWPEVEARFVSRYIPDLVAIPVAQATERARAGELRAALAALEQESTTDQNLEIPLLAESLARATGVDPELWQSLAKERFVGLFQSARQLIDRGHPNHGLSILLRLAPLAHLVLPDGSQRPLAMARLLSLIGSALDDASRYGVSEEAYQACLTLLDPYEPHHLAERAKTFSNLGALHQLDGQFEKSSRLLDEAVSTFERLPASEEVSYGLTAALINRGHSANYRGRPAAAEADWQRAIALAAGTSVHHDALAAEAAIHLAGQQFDREEWPKALATFRLGWRAALRAGDGARRAELIALAGQGALRAHQDDRALRLYTLARKRFEAFVPNHLADYLDTLRGEARALGYRGAFEEARTIASRALDEGIEALGDPHEQNMRSEALLADLCWDAGAYMEGQIWAERARADAQALFPPDHPTNLMQESRLAEFLLVEGRGAEAIGILLDVLAREPLLTGRLIDGDSDLVDLSAMRTAKSQLDLATLAVLRTAPDDQDSVMRLTDCRLRFGGSGLALLASRRSGQALPEELGRTLLSTQPGARSLVATTTLFREAGVERRALALWTGSSCTLHDLGPTGDADQALSKWSRAPWRPASPTLDPMLDLIHMHAGSCDRLLWFPDSALALVPLAALFTRKHPRIVENFAVIQSRDAYASLAPASPPSDRALLVGISEFGSGDGAQTERPLPSVRTEIAYLAALYPGAAMLLDADATIPALVEALTCGPAIVHIATHGLSEIAGGGRSRLRRALQRPAADDPLQRCAILMSGHSPGDCLLTARDLAAWDLGSVRLFVLAACDSGVGLNDAAEGSLGFQAALHHAGVSTFLASLWPIGDAESALLMDTFHARLRAGDRPSIALQKAQLAAAVRGDNPATWGGLILSGHDDPLAAACKPANGAIR